MNSKLMVLLWAMLLSCNNDQASKPTPDSLTTTNAGGKDAETQMEIQNQEIKNVSDTTSSDYLIYLLRKEAGLSHFWTHKLETLAIPLNKMDTLSRFSLIRDWIINDSISVIIISHATGTGYDEYLLTVKNKQEFISKIHISDRADSDLSPGNPYYYTTYELTNDRNLKLFHHKIVGVQGGEERDNILSQENWAIQDNGNTLKK